MPSRILSCANQTRIPVEIFDSPEQTGVFVADRIAAVIRSNGSDVPICFATGATPVPVYQTLRAMYERGAISFQTVRAFLLDEYVGLDRDHEQSFSAFMRTHLFDHVDLPPERFIAPDGRAYDPTRESRRYSEELTAAGGCAFMILGIGPNGHIAFNEPPAARDSRTRLVALSANTREANARFFADSNKVPKHAITMGIADILDSREIALMATGKSKAAILKKAFTEPPTADVPASWLQDYSGTLTLVLDAAAADELPLTD